MVNCRGATEVMVGVDPSSLASETEATGANHDPENLLTIDCASMGLVSGVKDVDLQPARRVDGVGTPGLSKEVVNDLPIENHLSANNVFWDNSLRSTAVEKVSEVLLGVDDGEILIPDEDEERVKHPQNVLAYEDDLIDQREPSCISC